MKTYIDISDEQREFLRAYPHPWSFLGKKSDNFVLPSWMNTEQYQMLSLRVARVCLKDTLSEISPLYPSVSEGRIQYPLFLTSANLSGDPESHTLAEAKGVFPGVE